MRRVWWLLAVVLTAAGCSPEQTEAWLDWWRHEPRAAVRWAKHECGALCTDDWDRDGIVEPEPETEPEAEAIETDQNAEDESGWGKWDSIIACESGGNWTIDSTFDGGLQFHPDTWREFGGEEFAPYAYMAEPWQQIAIAERVLTVQGWNAWPTCAARAGYL